MREEFFLRFERAQLLDEVEDIHLQTRGWFRNGTQVERWSKQLRHSAALGDGRPVDQRLKVHCVTGTARIGSALSIRGIFYHLHLAIARSSHSYRVRCLGKYLIGRLSRAATRRERFIQEGTR